MKLQPAINFLAAQQLDNGQFMGNATTDVNDFSHVVKQPTTFFNSLIIKCLENVPNTKDTRGLAANWLLKQKADSWSWNYWQKDHPVNKLYPYPDDLDDTSCALSAISSYQADAINGQTLAYLAKHLISAEDHPGGPYRTWLVGANAQAPWNDVDPAVNANIGSFLASQNVSLQPLNNYFDDVIKHHKYRSLYYLGDIPTIYFLARWYRGHSVEDLRDFIKQRLVATLNQSDSLRLAMLVSAGCRLGLDDNLLSEARLRLISLASDDHWPAEALYKDPAVNNQQLYAGSEALTTAFGLEALASQEYEIIDRVIARQTSRQRLRLQNLNAPLLTRRFTLEANNIAGRDHDGQISRMGDISARALDFRTTSETIGYINLASTAGWMAYGIFDAIADEHLQTEDIALASFALRQTGINFGLAVESSSFRVLVDDTLDTVDEANEWELSQARAKIKGSNLLIEHWPDYKDLSQLANKSQAHCLSTQAIAYLSGHHVRSDRQLSIRRFFKYYLIARQLNDDAHDWEEDLLKGHLSPVVCMLLRDFGLRDSYALSNLAELRLVFWNRTIVDVAKLIQDHTKIALDELEACGLKDPTNFKAWVKALDMAATTAINERHKNLEFIEVFNG